MSKGIKATSVLIMVWFLIKMIGKFIFSVAVQGVTVLAKYASMPDDILIFDGGHNIIKGCTTNGRLDFEFAHGLKPLTRSQYEGAIAGLGPDGSPDYVQVNEKYYVVGDSATQYPDLQRVTGFLRYTREYIGVFLAVMLYRVYKSGRNVGVYASYPTGDYDHRKLLQKALWGEWVVTVNGKTKIFTVGYINTYEEARGGANNLILADNGVSFENKDINDGDFLVIDLGGGTTDFRSGKDGKVTGLVARSIDLGGQNIENNLESMLLSKRDETRQLIFAGYRNLPLEQLRRAIKTKRWQGGGIDIDVSFEVQQSINMLLTAINQIYNAPLERKGCGGPMIWRYIILTGGVSAMLYDDLKPILKHHQILLAEKDITKMQFANVHGGRKLWKLGLSQGWL